MGRKQITLLPTGEAPEFAEGANFGEDGELVVKKVIAEKVTAETGEFKKGVTIYDKQGEAGCVFVENVQSGAVNVMPGKCDENEMPSP